MKTILSKKNLNYFNQHWTLYLLLILPLTYFIVFRYMPMGNILVAFKNYNLTRSVWDMDWAANNGFAHFIQAFNTQQFRWALRNTVMLNILDLIVGFPAPIIIALILNELKFKIFKKVTQTIAYMPHFLSWIIVSGMAVNLLAPNTGTVNLVLQNLGLNTIPFLNSLNFNSLRIRARIIGAGNPTIKSRTLSITVFRRAQRNCWVLNA